MSSFEKARKWRRLSVVDGRHLQELWGANKENNIDHMLERKPCSKCKTLNNDACRPYSWAVESMLELIRLVGALQHQNPQCLLWFRGEDKWYENATPKACREGNNKWYDFLRMTKWFNSNAIEGRLFLNRGELARWAILQHYGAPTPLLDVTTSLRIATACAFYESDDNDSGKPDWNKISESPHISVFATPRPLDGINIFAEIGLCLVDLVAELPSHCLRPHVQRAGFLGLTDIVMDGLDSCKKQPSIREANLDCVCIARICITKTDGFLQKPNIDNVFPPASKFANLKHNDSKKDDMSGDYLLCALYELNKLNKLSKSSKPCPLKNEFPTHYWKVGT
jgi:hypothetical protein